MAKKTNYIQYELKKLEGYLKQLQGYLDDNPPDAVQDRLEIQQSTRGNPIIKVIASKEDQIKMFLIALEKFPKLLEDINRLRKSVEGEEEKNVRGGQQLPAFMLVNDSEDDNTDSFENMKEQKEEIFEDDPINKPKELPSSILKDDNWEYDEDLEDE